MILLHYRAWSLCWTYWNFKANGVKRRRHGVISLESSKKYHGENRRDTLAQGVALAWCLVRQEGRGSDAEALLEYLLKLYRRFYGEDHQFTWELTKFLAQRYWDQQRWKKAEEVGLQLLEIQKKALGEDQLISDASMTALHGVELVDLFPNETRTFRRRTRNVGMLCTLVFDGQIVHGAL
jgi:hypothetical protein